MKYKKIIYSIPLLSVFTLLANNEIISSISKTKEVLPVMQVQEAPNKNNDAPVQKEGKIIYKNLTIDTKADEILIKGEVLSATYGLECLLCKQGFKEHESVISTQAPAWQLHAGLLALGLTPGIPAEMVNGKYQPPRGPNLDINVKWKNKDGKEIVEPITNWMKLSGKGNKKQLPKHWVFIGSMISPDGSYFADSTGAIISVSNLSDSVIDVPFHSTLKLEDRIFSIDPKKIPPKGTKITLVIKPKKGAKKSPYARAILDIDPWGRLKIDGQKIPVGKLTEWAEHFSDKHEHAMVIIRSAGETQCLWAPIAQLELKVGGIYYFKQFVSSPIYPIMPITEGQLAWLMKQWTDEAKDEAVDLEALKREYDRLQAGIKLKLQEIQYQKKILTKYKTQLENSYNKYSQKKSAR